MEPGRQSLEGPLTTTLLLLCIAPTASSRHGGFADPGEPLDEGGMRAANKVQLNDRHRVHVHCSPARAARDTAIAMGLTTIATPQIADMDHGDWTGRSFEQIATFEPDAFSQWLADPAGGAPGGETMEAVRARTASWLDDMARHNAVTAITHPMTIRAVVAQAIGLPLRATLAIDIAPLSRTILSYNRQWRLQSISCGD